MSKTNDILRALGYKPLQNETETSEKPLCKNATKAALQSALGDEKENTIQKK